MRGPSLLYWAARFSHDVGWDIWVARRAAIFSICRWARLTRGGGRHESAVIFSIFTTTDHLRVACQSA